MAATHYSKPAFTAHLAHPHEAAEIDRLIAHGLPAAQRANTPQFAWPASCGGFRRGWGGWGWGLPLAGLGLGLGYYGYPYYSSYYSDPCVEWDGYTWVNICY